MSHSPRDLSAVLERWTYKPTSTSASNTLYNALNNLTSIATSADALSSITKALKVQLSSVNTGRNINLDPIRQKYHGDTLTNEVISAVNSLIDDMKTDVQQQNDILYNKDKARSHRTEYDIYLVPLENLVVKSSSPKTRPDLEQK